MPQATIVLKGLKIALDRIAFGSSGANSWTGENRLIISGDATYPSLATRWRSRSKLRPGSPFALEPSSHNRTTPRDSALPRRPDIRAQPFDGY